MNVAIIPARYGSKRVKLKNIKNFYHKPIIFWTIQKLIKSKIFDFIVVTSDSNRILKISKKFGANILIKRPKGLSDDKTATKPVIVHAIDCLKKKIKKKINAICCIYPCNPFVLIKDLRKAFDIFKRDNSKFIFTVTEYSHPIQRALKLNKVFGVKPISKNNMNKRTQDLEKTYFDSGQFYFGSEILWRSKKNAHECGEPIIIPSWRSIDIDNIDDWKRAEILFKSYHDLLKI
jgi:pseudaminic acid cytidylyltransferase